jgi:TM2 domain-containing membrane protein YozV
MPRPAFGMAPARPGLAPAPPSADPQDEMAARRAAFVAAERARKTEAQRAETLALGLAASAPKPRGPSWVSRREKSMIVAYCFWFFGGTLGGHRLYLGFIGSGMLQAGLWFGSLLLMLRAPIPGLVGLAANFIWVIVDAFLIPGLYRRVKEAAQRRTIGAVFD